MRTVLVALGLALTSLPAYAQMTQTTARSEEQQKADKEADEAYKAMTKQLRDKPRNTDPWANVRNSEAAANTTPPAGTAPAPRQATAKKPKHPAN
jgi:uncharacterized protein YecT (DUF1311 family)